MVMANRRDNDLLGNYHAELSIDRDDLDECWVKQPELFYQVANAHVQAIARKDAVKLEVEECEAEENQKIRAAAVKAGEKVTEGAIGERLRLNKKYSDLQHQLLDCQAELKAWEALKEAYGQRSFALRDLVAMHISRSASGGSAVGVRNDLAEHNRKVAGEERARRRSRESD